MFQCGRTLLVGFAALLIIAPIVVGQIQPTQKSTKAPKRKKLRLNEPLPPNIPPASCLEWQTQDIPIYNPKPAMYCKPLGGTDFCNRVSGTTAGTLDIGPISGIQAVNQRITVHFRLRDFGSGDAVVYFFGKVDWGDTAQQQLYAFNTDVPLTHTYTTMGNYVVHAMSGAQFKYQAGPLSGSYEACADNSIPIKITP